MTKFYNSAIFTEKSTGRVLHRLNSKPFDKAHPYFSKFYWEKEKAEVLEKLVKDRFLTKSEIDIKDYNGAI